MNSIQRRTLALQVQDRVAAPILVCMKAVTACEGDIEKSIQYLTTPHHVAQTCSGGMVSWPLRPTPPTDKAEIQAQGAAAYLAKKFECDNPYSERSQRVAHREWERGYAGEALRNIVEDELDDAEVGHFQDLASDGSDESDGEY